MSAAETSLEPDTLALFTILARTGLFLDALQRECLGSHRLAFKEYSVLRLLQRPEGRSLTPTQLAEEIVCTSGAMTKLVDRLERAGLVERMPDPDDRRGVRVQITDEGDRAANEAAETYRSGRTRVLERLGEREAADIHTGLTRLLEAFEADRNPDSSEG